jgi:hypothetical protein
MTDPEEKRSRCDFTPTFNVITMPKKLLEQAVKDFPYRPISFYRRRRELVEQFKYGRRKYYRKRRVF